MQEVIQSGSNKKGVCHAMRNNVCKTGLMEQEKREKAMDYKKYHCNMAQMAWCVLVGALISAVISWLLYRSWYAMVLMIPVTIWYWKMYQKEQIRVRKKKLLCEFKDAMQAVSASLLAGYALENAWREGERELLELYGKNSLMYQEMHQMNSAVQMNEPLEKAIAGFAQRSGCEEIESFGEVFSFAKRSSGDFPEIIKATVQRLSARIEVEQEISAVIAGKKLEGTIMSIMPAAILGWLNISSPDFLDALYGNPTGILIMSMALVIYAMAQRWSAKILDIQV